MAWSPSISIPSQLPRCCSRKDVVYGMKPPTTIECNPYALEGCRMRVVTKLYTMRGRVAAEVATYGFPVLVQTPKLASRVWWLTRSVQPKKEAGFLRDCTIRMICSTSGDGGAAEWRVQEQTALLVGKGFVKERFEKAVASKLVNKYSVLELDLYELLRTRPVSRRVDRLRGRTGGRGVEDCRCRPLGHHGERAYYSRLEPAAHCAGTLMTVDQSGRPAANLREPNKQPQAARLPSIMHHHCSPPSFVVPLPAVQHLLDVGYDSGLDCLINPDVILAKITIAIAAATTVPPANCQSLRPHG
ncbi:hypothetical protein B0H10DRAFT_2351911 [Mycena sp. CBHHK59/15]|nr:hypothetical protein B0H10DRAFT_2351911 [Mycena sp. CBHHK59/15]